MAKATYMATLISMSFLWQVAHAGIYENPQCFPGFTCCGMIKEALRCMDEATVIPSANASTFLESQANFVENYYVFSSIARDPGSIVQTNPFNLSVYDGKVDLVGGLRQLAQEYNNDQNANVSFARLLGKSNDLFVLSRDMHLRPFMVDVATSPLASYAFVLSSNAKTLTEGTDAFGTRVGFRMYGSGADPEMKITSGRDIGKVVSSINGLSPLKWVENITDADVVPAWGVVMKNTPPTTDTGMGYKGRGNRIANPLINAGVADGGLAFFGTQSGTLTRLDADKMKVIFSDNTEAEWVWFALGIEKTRLPLAPVPAIAALQTALSNINIKPVLDLRRQLQAVDATPPKLNQAPARMLNQKERFISADCPTGAEYCVLKMTTFDHNLIPAAEYISTFNAMAIAAYQRGIKKILFDLNSNGGGTIPLGFLATQSLMPTLEAAEICDKFSAKLGPLNQFLVDQGWYGTPFRNLLTEKVLDMNATNKYALALAQNNCARFNKTISNIDSILTALFTLYGATGPTTRFNQQDKDTIQFYSDLLPTVKQACLDGNIIPPSSIPSTSAEFAKYVAGYLQRLQRVFGNIATGLALSDEFGSLATIDVAGEVLNYTVPQNRLPPPGFCHDTFFGKLDPIVSSPFEEISAISDGMCGSTCGFFGLAALFHSLGDSSLPNFRFVVHGGLGTPPQDQILTPTVFHGGNVMQGGSDQGADMWGFYASTAIFTWTSNLTLPRLDELVDLIPDFQVYSKFPDYTVHMGHSSALGKEALPTEYYLPLNSHYLPKWYYDIGMDGAGLAELYSDAATFFSSKPDPDGGFNIPWWIWVILAILLIPIGICVYERRRRAYTCFGLIRRRNVNTKDDEAEEEGSGSKNDLESCSSENHHSSAVSI